MLTIDGHDIPLQSPCAWSDVPRAQTHVAHPFMSVHGKTCEVAQPGMMARTAINSQ